MRQKIYNIIEPSDGNSKLSDIYDFIMMATIVISINTACLQGNKRCVPMD